MRLIHHVVLILLLHVLIGHAVCCDDIQVSNEVEASDSRHIETDIKTNSKEIVQ